MSSVRVSDFDFHLPSELIAQRPPAARGDSRMMTVDRASGTFADRHFRDFPLLLRPGDLLVLNDSRVIPARLFGRRAGLRTQRNSPSPTGSVEVLLTESLGDRCWRTLVKPARKVAVGERLSFGLFGAGNGTDSQNEPLLTAGVIAAGEFGERTLQFAPTDDFFAALDQLGHMPLPPYIHRELSQEEASEDRERYQTVYAGVHGSAAAPTAGLHFTPAILQHIRERGVDIQYITLHVGLGTFQPVREQELDRIRLHEEHYTVPPATAEAILEARADGRRIVAVGTTTTRTLEHIATTGRIEPHTGSTRIFIRPSHHFQLVSALLTNFHLPQSTLLMLVSAFLGEINGRETILAAYNHAVAASYRFFSYGDCMFLS